MTTKIGISHLAVKDINLFFKVKGNELKAEQCDVPLMRSAVRKASALKIPDET
jgi:hypothetical protein